MNRLIHLVSCASLLALAYSPAQAGKLDKALEAYNNRDYVASARLYAEIAEQGDAEAQYRLGSQYDLGEGLPSNMNEALKWYRLSAKHNYPKAQARLGQVYQLGRGVPKDSKAAAEWYRKAAHQGDPEAQAALGQLYFSGTGVSKDYGQAARWLTRAARQDESDAQSLLGSLYAEGKGVRRNYVQAYFWKSLAGVAEQKKQPSDALAKGLAEARAQMNVQARDGFAQHMTERELNHARKLLSQWKPKPERQL